MQDLQNALIVLYFNSQLQHSRFSALQNAYHHHCKNLILRLHLFSLLFIVGFAFIDFLY